MRVLARGTLRDFWQMPGKQDSEEPLQAWYAHAVQATWANQAAVRVDFPSAGWVGSDRAVFIIGSNKYRLVVKFDFEKHQIYIRFIGTSKQYDQMKDISTI